MFKSQATLNEEAMNRVEFHFILSKALDLNEQAEVFEVFFVAFLLYPLASPWPFENSDASP